MTSCKTPIRIFATALTIASIAFSTTSCVENSAKYRELQAQLDSLQGNYGQQKNQLDEIFSIINEVEEGLNDIRTTEKILTVENSKENSNISENQRTRMLSDVNAVKEAIARYKERIEELKKENSIKSVEFRKRLNALTKELEEKAEIINDLQRQLKAKDVIISRKEQTIDSLGRHVSDLKEDISALTGEKEDMQQTIATQDKAIYSAYYIIGSKSELIEAGVLSRGGLFKSAKISYEAEKTSFIKIDYREISTINTNSSRAKVLSNHRRGTYSIEEVDGQDILTISDPEGFWEQTKYLVIQTQ